MQTTGSRTPAQQTALITLGGRTATFTGLMDLYEQNYILLELLFANHDPGTTMTMDYPDKRHQLQLTPLEHERYTTTVLLTYSLLNRHRHILTQIVKLKIRIYHDTRQAELFHPSNDPCEDTAVTHGRNKVIAVKWTLNKFLNKVLESIQPMRGCP